MINKAVLFVDDDVLTQWLMTEALADAGYEVTSACRGAEASQLLHAAHGFDLLVTDIDLPDLLSGTDLGRLWEMASTNRPVLYIGTPGHPAVRHLASHEGFLAKPFTPAMLLSAVENVWEEAVFQPARASGQRPCHVN